MVVPPARPCKHDLLRVCFLRRSFGAVSSSIDPMRFRPVVLLAVLLLPSCKARSDYEITFSTDRDESLDLFGMTPDSSYFRAYTGDDGTEYGVRWSPDGTTLLYTGWRGGNADVVAFNLERGNIRRLVQGPGYDGSPDWSPDGRHIVFVSDRDGERHLYRTPVDSLDIVQLTGPATVDTSPRWSPDGDLIVFTRSDPESTEQGAIMTMKADGSEVRKLTSGDTFDSLADWSPDGGRIAFHRCVDGACTLWTMRPDGTDERQLVDDEYDNRWPAWSPDGEWIAYTSARDDQTDIYVVRPDGSDMRRVTRWPGRDEAASWRPVPRLPETERTP